MNEDKIHKKYIEILRNMTPQQKIDKIFELNKLGDDLFRTGLKKRFPNLTKEEFNKLYKSRIEKCYNRDW
jgi:hypothetical protein